MCAVFPITSNSNGFDSVIDDAQMVEYPTLYLYYMSQDSEPGFNSIRSCVVCAESQKDALDINPFSNDAEVWPGAESIKLIGKAYPGIKAGEVICASFNHLLLN